MARILIKNGRIFDGERFFTETFSPTEIMYPTGRWYIDAKIIYHTPCMNLTVIKPKI